MDPHFNEYLAAVAGMLETYGDRPDGHSIDVDDELDAVAIEEPAVSVSAG